MATIRKRLGKWNVQIRRQGMTWEKAEYYDYTLNHKAPDWAWEFLRRNPNYLSQWQEVFREFKRQPSHQVLMEALLADDLA